MVIPIIERWGDKAEKKTYSTAFLSNWNQCFPQLDFRRLPLSIQAVGYCIFSITARVCRRKNCCSPANWPKGKDCETTPRAREDSLAFGDVMSRHSQPR